MTMSAGPDRHGTGDTSEVAEPLLELLRSCVVQIYGDGRFYGTGFFVAPGEVLTCAHVIRGWDEIRVEHTSGDSPATVIITLPALAADDPRERFYPLPDVALLRLTDPPHNHACVRFDLSIPVSGPDPDGLRLDAFAVEHIRDTVAHGGVSLIYEGPVDEKGFRLLKLTSGQVINGYSGGPILNRRTGGVCALVDSTRDKRADLGGFGVPLMCFLNQLPGLRKRNHDFHNTDDRWQRAWHDERQRTAEREQLYQCLPLQPADVSLETWKPEEHPPSDLLRPRYQVVDFLERGPLMEDLLDWRESKSDLGVVILAGAGGAGKTRTAVEVCMRTRSSRWGETGLLLPNPDDKHIDQLVRYPGRLLVVVDYAETCPEAVARLLRELPKRSGRPPVRVVLVVRQLSTPRELEQHFTGIKVTDGREEITQLLRRARLVHLNGHKHTIDRRELFTRAAGAFATRMGVTAPEDVPNLEKEHFARPLYVNAAALLAVNNHSRDVSALNDDELLGAILDEHEAHYWDRWNTQLKTGLDGDTQRRMVALAALLGAASDPDTDVIVRLAFTSLGLTDQAAQPSTVRLVKKWLTRLYGALSPSRGTGLCPLEPDLLAEVLIARELADQPDLITAALQVDSDAQVTRAWTVLTRATSVTVLTGATSDRAELRATVRGVLNEHLPALIRRLGAK